MEKLDPIYLEKLQDIRQRIQASDTLQTYLEDETEPGFQALREEFEPEIHALYMEVGNDRPFQLLDLEQNLFDADFEGLYLPKILGYTILRGDVNEQGKYRRPQDQFGLAVQALARSNNFEMLKNKTGQTLQIGFSLSSDIWVSNLVDHIENKRSKIYFENLRTHILTDEQERKASLVKYGRQFEGAPYHSAEFPQTPEDLKSLYIPLKDFLLHRISRFSNITSLTPYLTDLIRNEKLYHLSEFWSIIFIVTNFFKLEGSDKELLKRIVNDNRRNSPDFSDHYFSFLHSMHQAGMKFDANVDRNAADILDPDIQDDVKRYFELAEIIHSKGYMHEDTIEAVRNFYESNEGLSIINTTVRNTILSYFKGLLQNLSETDYQDYFSMSRIFNTYMKIFANEKFNQEVQALNQQFIHKLLTRFNDKRGKDYQEIKKFVSSHFAELEYMKEKDISELFKTKRKKATI